MINHNTAFRRAPLLAGLMILLAGCASTEEMMRNDPDPLVKYNRPMFTFNDKLDKAVFKPVAKAYNAVMPAPANTAVTNFFGNLRDVVTLANDLLQLKFHQAAMDTSRVIANTVFGLGGLIDVARHMDLPKHDEDFGQTLSYWSGAEGYYLVLPVLGPNSTVDIWGLPGDSVANPLYFVSTTTAAWAGLQTLYFVDLRADLLRIERVIEDMQIDPYAFQRQAYLQRRRNLVFDGNPPTLKPDFEESEEAAPQTQ